MRALLVHSPLVGPSTMTGLAASIAARDWDTTTPDLRAAIESPEDYWRAAVAAAGPTDVVIGHSGAGAFLPIIAEHIGAKAMVFIDAVVPEDEPWFHPSAAFMKLLAQLPVTDGVLPPWHTWWPEAVLHRLLPDERQRAEIVDEIPQLRLAFYDQPVPVPKDWRERPAAYLQLNPSYAPERQRAEQWGWPTRHSEGHHLDAVVIPDAIAELVLELIEELFSG